MFLCMESYKFLVLQSCMWRTLLVGECLINIKFNIIFFSSTYSYIRLALGHGLQPESGQEGGAIHG